MVREFLALPLNTAKASVRHFGWSLPQQQVPVPGRDGSIRCSLLLAVRQLNSQRHCRKGAVCSHETMLTSMGKSLQLDGAQETVNIDGKISSTGWCPGDCVNINCKFSSTGWCPGDYVNISGKISSAGCLPEDFVHLTV